MPQPPTQQAPPQPQQRPSSLQAAQLKVPEETKSRGATIVSGVTGFAEVLCGVIIRPPRSTYQGIVVGVKRRWGRTTLHVVSMLTGAADESTLMLRRKEVHRRRRRGEPFQLLYKEVTCMAKRARLPSSDEEGGGGGGRARSPSSVRSRSRGKEEKKKKKEKSKKEEKPDTKSKADKKDKSEAKFDKKDKKSDKHKTKVDPEGKKEKKEKKSKEPASTEVAFAAGVQTFRDAKRPFGLELDGSLVVDIADKGAEGAAAAGVQIGWRVAAIDGQPVPQEDEGVAASRLREAEMRISRAGRDSAGARVKFVTEEPDHWKQAALRGLRPGKKRWAARAP